MCKGIYSPRLAEDLIHAVFLEAENQGRPMTRVVDEAVRIYLKERGWEIAETPFDARRIKKAKVALGPYYRQIYF